MKQLVLLALAPELGLGSGSEPEPLGLEQVLEPVEARVSLGLLELVSGLMGPVTELGSEPEPLGLEQASLGLQEQVPEPEPPFADFVQRSYVCRILLESDEARKHKKLSPRQRRIRPKPGHPWLRHVV